MNRKVRSAVYRKRSGLIAFILMLCAGMSFAQSYPAKPIRIIVPVGPGGGLDAVARLIGAKLTESLGQPVVIDNRPGAGGSIGLELASRAAPDGYTLTALSSSQIINAALTKPPYDLFRDFAPLSQTASAPYVLVVHPALNTRSVNELVAYAKANPGKLNYASLGNGTLQHLAMELLAVSAGVSLLHVPYKGLGAAFPDLLSNRVQTTMSSITSLVPHIRSKALRPLAVTSAQRTKELPELPTMIEAGMRGFVVTQWHGLLAPRGTLPSLLERLHDEVAKAVHHPDTAARLEKDSTEPVGSTPRAFASLLKEEHAKWSGVIKQTGLRIE